MSQQLTQALQATWPILLFFAIFYFLFYRPQKKQQQRRAEMLANLKKGDKVVTIGGMYGTITDLTDRIVTLRVADKVEIDFQRKAISHPAAAEKKEETK